MEMIRLDKDCMERSTSSKTDRSRSNEPNSRRSRIDPELYARLQAEAKAPYRSLRRFIYVAFGASGLIGGFIFLSQLLAGQTTSSTIGNLAIQSGVVALMVYLWRIDRSRK